MKSDVLLEQLLSQLRKHHLKLRTAESCTAGGIASRVAAVAGVSDVLDRGWITYSNESKVELLGVDAGLLDQYGAVSSEVVMAMAEGGAGSDAICVAVSGIAGPSGAQTDKPVGTVWIAVAYSEQKTVSQCFHFSGERCDVQRQTIEHAMALLIQVLEDM